MGSVAFEIVFETPRVPSSYITKDTFSGIPMFVAAHAKSEAESVECRLEVRGIVSEKSDVRYLLFLSKLAETHCRELRSSRPKGPKVEELVYAGMNAANSQSVSIVENHRLVNRDLIRISSMSGRRSTFRIQS